MPEGVVVDALDVVEGEVQRLQVRVSLAVERPPGEHPDFVVLKTTLFRKDA